MINKIIEISTDGTTLTKYKGFLCISFQDGQTHKIPTSEILALILSAHDAVISKNIVSAITEGGGTLLLCGKNYVPTSIILPYTSHWQQGERIRKQISASTPLQKSLWKTIIERKINNQALVLSWVSHENSKVNRLKHLARTVKSGDTTNNEAVAARLYFKELFGDTFTRDRNASDINILLNYSYTILRSCIARAIAGAGLMPALGIMHSNKLNPLTLVDDLIEPYRPLADIFVVDVISQIGAHEITLTPEIKRGLAKLVSTNIATYLGNRPLSETLLDTANSLAKSYIDKKNRLELHTIIDPRQLF